MPGAALSARAARVTTIPAGISFVDALAAGLIAETAADPLALARYTILLPTRRARRALVEAFLRQGDGQPLLLPRVLPLGDLDPDDISVTDDEAGADGTPAVADLPPAIPALRRQLLLTQAIQAASRSGATPQSVDQAARLAAELARLLDQLQTDQIAFERLRELVPADYAVHWQLTLRFLSVLTEQWPALLQAEGCLDPAERRNLVLAAQAEAWRRAPPADPIIAAGSTGSIPATAALIATIADLPQGRVVLPGLDRTADEVTWVAIAEDPAHPQHGLALLLQRLELAPADIGLWLASGLPATPPSRARLIGEALRPAVTTESWRSLAAAVRSDAVGRERLVLALRDVTRIDCPGPQEEAGVIALILREALEEPGKRAALVTPDRDLARRVAAELRRWDIAIDDSAGQPLADTPPGLFLRLIAELFAEGVAPVPLLAVLKHPLAAAGLPPADFRARARKLERELLRGARPSPGFAGLKRALGRDDEGKEIGAFIDRLAAPAAPFAEFIEARHARLVDLLDAHIRLAEALAATDTDTGAARLWAGDAGEAAANFVAELRQAAAGFAPLAGERYPVLLADLMSALVVRPRYGRHPRLAIWGPLEARLQHADLVILGGLNEGTWPAEPAADPWLSRPMRRALGLPAPERRIGLSAHDFAQAFGAREVVLTRASRVEGAPTVPSRWLLRLDGLLRTLGLEADLLEGRQWLDWQAKLDRADRVQPVGPPAPTPPVVKRPRRLSVTQIETWRRDPYAVYARHILRLAALDPLDAEPSAADRGMWIHHALERFVAEHPGELPADSVERLLATGRRLFGPLFSRPALRAFWWPRFERIAAWFIARERERRAGLTAIVTEVRGSLSVPAPFAPFELTATADRIDIGHDGRLAIIDYKTGSLPSDKAIAAGFAPQLPLEAAIAIGGGFRDIEQASVAALAFWRLSGGDPPGLIKPIEGEPAEQAKIALAGLRRLVEAYDLPDTPYPAVPDPYYAPRYSDYAHLARVKEWTVSETEGGE
jgi:ATP-dependent helicase/nuclease subunit B